MIWARSWYGETFGLVEAEQVPEAQLTMTAPRSGQLLILRKVDKVAERSTRCFKGPHIDLRASADCYPESFKRFDRRETYWGPMIRFAYVGLAVSSRLLARNPALVERFLRGVIKGREYARRYHEQTIPMIGKYTQRKREFNELDYDTTLPVMTAEGWVPDEVLKEDVAVRAELVNVAPPADFAKFFDYSIVKKIYREIRTSGWKPTP